MFFFLYSRCAERNVQIGNINCVCCAKTFGLVDYHVVTDTISLGSIPGEGSGALHAQALIYSTLW